VYVYTSDLISANLSGQWSVPAASVETGHAVVWENSAGDQCGLSVLQSGSFIVPSESESESESETSETETESEDNGSTGDSSEITTPEQDESPRFAIYPQSVEFSQEGGTKSVYLFREPTNFALTVDESSVSSYENADGELGVLPEIHIYTNSILISAPENLGYDWTGLFVFYAAGISYSRKIKVTVAGALGAKSSESESSESESSESESSESESSEAPFITPAATRLTVFCHGSDIALSVKSNLSGVSAESNADWLTASLSDSGVLSIRVEINTTEAKRVGVITISEPETGVAASVQIAQESRYYDAEIIPLFDASGAENFKMLGTMFEKK